MMSPSSQPFSVIPPAIIRQQNHIVRNGVLLAILVLVLCYLYLLEKKPTYKRTAELKPDPETKPNRLASTYPQTLWPIKVENCTVKSQGSTAGKVCDTKNETLYLKASYFEYPCYTAFNPNHTLYNLQIARQLEIRVPDFRLAQEPNGSYVDCANNEVLCEVYLASTFNPGFTSIQTLMQSLSKQYYVPGPNNRPLIPMINPYLSDTALRKLLRERLLNKIGVDSIAKLINFSTLVCNTAANPGNWGFDSTGLFVVDIDDTPLNKADFFSHAQVVFANLPFDLSSNDLTKMIKNYERLLDLAQSKELIIGYEVPENDYIEVIKKFKESCETTLKAIDSERPTIAPDQPNPAIVKLLQNEMYNLEYRSSLSH